jgi:hypothetical protein
MWEEAVEAYFKIFSLQAQEPKSEDPASRLNWIIFFVDALAKFAKSGYLLHHVYPYVRT